MFGLRELTGYELYQLFASVVVRRDRSAINTLAPSEGSLFSATSDSAGESDCDTHNVVVGIRTLLQVNSDVSDKLGAWLSRNYVVKTFPVRGLGTVECTRRSSLWD